MEEVSINTLPAPIPNISESSQSGESTIIDKCSSTANNNDKTGTVASWLFPSIFKIKEPNITMGLPLPILNAATNGNNLLDSICLASPASDGNNTNSRAGSNNSTPVPPTASVENKRNLKAESNSISLARAASDENSENPRAGSNSTPVPPTVSIENKRNSKTESNSISLASPASDGNNKNPRAEGNSTPVPPTASFENKRNFKTESNSNSLATTASDGNNENPRTRSSIPPPLYPIVIIRNGSSTTEQNFSSLLPTNTTFRSEANSVLLVPSPLDGNNKKPVTQQALASVLPSIIPPRNEERSTVLKLMQLLLSASNKQKPEGETTSEPPKNQIGFFQTVCKTLTRNKESDTILLAQASSAIEHETNSTLTGNFSQQLEPSNECQKAEVGEDLDTPPTAELLASADQLKDETTVPAIPSRNDKPNRKRKSDEESESGKVKNPKSSDPDGSKDGK